MHAGHIPEVIKHQYEWESPQKGLPSHSTHFGDHTGVGACAELAPYHITAAPHGHPFRFSVPVSDLLGVTDLLSHSLHGFMTLKTICKQFCIFAEGL